MLPVAGQLCPPLHPSTQIHSLGSKPLPRTLPCPRTYHCDSAELLQRPMVLLLAAKTGAAIAELRAVESWLHSTSSAVIQPYLHPCQKDRGQLSPARGSLWCISHPPHQQGERKGSSSLELSLPQLLQRTSRARTGSTHLPPSLGVSSAATGVSTGCAFPRSTVASQALLYHPAEQYTAGSQQPLGPTPQLRTQNQELCWFELDVAPSTPSLMQLDCLKQSITPHQCDFRTSLHRSLPCQQLLPFPGTFTSSGKEPAREDNNEQQQVLPSLNGTYTQGRVSREEGT